MPDIMLSYAIIMGVIAAFLFAKRLGILPEPSHDRRIADFFDGARRRGLSLPEACEELRLREAMIRVRNAASAWAIRDPGSWGEAITCSVEAEVAKMPKAMGRRFHAWAGSIGRRDILTSQAERIVADHERRFGDWRTSRWGAPSISEDRKAALRVR